MKTFELGEFTVAYQEKGDGPTVLLIHCSNGSHKVWSFVAPELEARYTVVAPDLIGYGESSTVSSFQEVAFDIDLQLLKALMDKIPKPVYLVGHSYGGALCLELARWDADNGLNQVCGLLLIEPVSFHLLRSENREKDWRKISKAAQGCIDAANRGEYKKAANSYMGFWLGQVKWRLAPKRFRHVVISTISKVAFEFQAMFSAQNNADEYKGITCPVALVHGGKSPSPAISVIEVLQSVLPHVSVEVIKKAGHMIPFTHKNQLKSIIHSRLEQIYHDA